MAEYQEQEDSKFIKFLKKIDLFAFLPVPKTDTVSSKRSMVGSCIMFSLFAAYIIANFVAFIINNAPRVNIYTETKNPQNTTLPPIAFAFFYGEPSVINNKSSVYFTMQQVSKFQNVTANSISVNIPLVQCKPDWLPDYNLSYLCPQNQTVMGGVLYETPVFTYPRITISICSQNTTSNNNSCVSSLQLSQTLAGGRVLLYIQNTAPQIDMSTGKEIEGVAYNVYQYFLMQNFYPRAQVTFQQITYNIFPDYFLRWKNHVNTYLELEDTNDWMTNVSIYNTALAYQIYFIVNQEQKFVDMIYLTILDEISKWGAFWGVLFAGFAAYFLAYNSNKFYQNNEEWSKFDSKIGIRRLSTIEKTKTIEMTDNSNTGRND